MSTMKRTFVIKSFFENKNLRLISASILGTVLAFSMIIVLINYAGLNLITLSEIIVEFPPWGIFAVLSMTFLNIMIGAYKWKLVVDHLSETEDKKPEYFFYLSHTALSAFVGLFVPVQVSTIIVRSFSLRAGGYGSVGKGAATSLISQFQDVFVILFFFVPGIVIVLWNKSASYWLIFVIALYSGGYIFFRFLSYRIVTRINMVKSPDSLIFYRSLLSFTLKLFREIANKDLLNPTLTIPLYFLSLLRFINLAGRSFLISWMIGLDISPVLIMSMSSIVQLSLIISITPGNLGFVEWGWVGLLLLVGVARYDAGQFALTMRVLGYSSTILIFVGVFILVFLRIAIKKLS